MKNKLLLLLSILLLSGNSHSTQPSQELTYLNAFEAAYANYPNIPRGYLEALAFVNTRWQHLLENQTLSGHYERPTQLGIMGLYSGDHNRQNQVAAAARALSIPVEQVLSDPASNIMATAAWITKLLEQQKLKNPTVEDMGSITAILLNLPAVNKSSTISRFIEDSQFYDLLLVLDRGYDDHGIFILDRPIRWQTAFSNTQLQRLRAPLIRMNADTDRILAEGVEMDPLSEHVLPPVNDTRAASPDYGAGANWIASPYHGSRTQSISAVTIHTTQGSYAGTLSWFQNNPYSVSAHYVIRSSDGQITQMVREYRRAHHVGIHNSSTLGIEHEGFVNNPAYYTNAMYTASANLTKHFCQLHNINCATTYDGPAHSSVVVLPNSTKIKGHQHFSGQNHTDPGIHWDWSRYHDLINGSGGGSDNDVILDNFEQSEGRFNTPPNYSGSTTGIASSSFAQRTSSIVHTGSYAEHIQLRDNPNTNAPWAVRFLSGSGAPANNATMNKAGGRIGFWIYVAASGVSVGVGVDDNDGTERSDSIALNANQWTYVEWKLDDSSQWNPWVNGNGILGSQVTLDAIWFYRSQTSYTVNIYIDQVQYRFEG
ncbi:N-acetylmuramoyl-L-alanine amidase [Marinicella sp. W31]|uniref:N-acetylmuramoyl-L-alanine amidase n=1 Tax=Marinicella sp. W31 TaxID=3023713 RepID=UPI00375795D0